MGWPTPRMPAPRSRRARVGVLPWAAAALAVVNLTVGTVVITWAYAERHLVGGGETDAGLANLLLQAIVVVIAIGALVLRSPRTAWMRSALVSFVLVGSSLVIAASCYAVASR